MIARRIIFASGNKHKLEEIKKGLIYPSVQLISMREIGFDGEIEETGKTLEENAELKARFIHDRYNVDCFADDTGLEVDALNGRPGVYSARYAGEGCSFEDNMNKMLFEMKDKPNRTARFKTIFHLILGGKEYQFKGEAEGLILRAPTGTNGFGYDPIFQPIGFIESFAEMSMNHKNKISHRALASSQLSEFLNKLN
jgi:XTP/dITP diphosphohydrolase